MKRIAFLAVVVGFIFAGCGGTETKETTNTANVPNTAVNAPPAPPPIENPVYTAGVKPRDDLISSTNKIREVKSWTAVTTSETNPDISIRVEYVAPDRYRIKQADGEIIAIGNDSYMNENGKWEKVDENLGDQIKSQTLSMTAEAIKTLPDVKIIGKEKLNGKDTAIYSYQKGETVTKIWIAVDSGLQLKYEIESNAGGQVQRQRTVYEYNKPIKIEAPKID